MAQRWYNADGSLNEKALAGKDVYSLITPSIERALLLNKAYRILVEDQDYIYGRDAIIEPPANVYEKIDNENTPTLPAQFVYPWDIRLNWGMSDADRTSTAQVR